MKRVFSGIQPSGDVHIGNYLGAIRHWVADQNTTDSFICIVDLHAITVSQEPAQLRRRTLDLAKLLVACGVNPAKATLFTQSDVPAHSELAWILSTITTTGELRRMTQYKDKSSKAGEESAGLGLFSYPVLMAADILLYDTDFVPVGEDQKQHLELTRDLAGRFNTKFGAAFTLPEPKIYPQGARIKSLSDSTRKMSKSDAPNSYIALLDSADILRQKVRKAVADEAGVKNLIEIYSELSGQPAGELKARFDGKNQELKEALTELLVTELGKIQAKYHDLSDSDIQDLLTTGQAKANEVANAKLAEIKSKIGLV